MFSSFFTRKICSLQFENNWLRRTDNETRPTQLLTWTLASLESCRRPWWKRRKGNLRRFGSNCREWPRNPPVRPCLVCRSEPPRRPASPSSCKNRLLWARSLPQTEKTKEKNNELVNKHDKKNVWACAWCYIRRPLNRGSHRNSYGNKKKNKRETQAIARFTGFRVRVKARNTRRLKSRRRIKKIE